ncbi:MAG: tetratricopeptide repeat protein [Patescibacteria group bacterium]
MNPSRRFESIAFYALLITVILVPLAFLPSSFVALDLIKTIVIAFGTLIAAISLGLTMYQEKKLVLPPRGITWTTLLLVISLIVSGLLSANVSRAFFGQGFETGTVSFILLLIVAGYIAFNVVNRRVERAGLLYAAFAGTYLIFVLFHFLRFVFGPGFAQLSILGSLASTFFGTWSSLGVFSFFISLVSLCAIMFLPLTGRMRIAYWVLCVVSAFAGFLVHPFWALIIFTASLFAFSAYLFITHRNHAGEGVSTWKSRISWIPTLGFVIFLVALIWGGGLANSLANSMHAGYTELALPWQMTLDIASGALKQSPLFGVGPNHFGQAFLTYKPLLINTTDLWGVEFGSGVGTLPTFVVNQGLLGGILWLLLLIFLGIAGIKTIRHLPENPYGRFITVSSFLASAFSWLTLLAYTPSHAFLFITFVMTGIWLGAATYYGHVHTLKFSATAENNPSRFVPIVTGIVVIVLIVWGLVYVKKTVALAYFASGVKHLTVEGNIPTAEKSFATATKIDPSDVYLQARSEVGLAKIRQLAGLLTGASQASSTQIAAEIAATLDQSFGYAAQAIALNPNNYYNHLAAGRVSELAMTFKIANSYESAVRSYTNAANLNPYNPSLYLNLARIHAAQGKYNEALQAIGLALQVKGNYTDAAFMASQVAAAQGNIKDAITAARVATQLSPNIPLTFFQLGILQYTDKDYAGAATSLESAVKLQADYANARYFLGLSQVRLGQIAAATAQFEELEKSNPNSQEVDFILKNLRAGKSPFADAQPPITPTPEKRSTLPLKDPEPKSSKTPTSVR